jgi:hypothetical protein
MSGSFFVLINVEFFDVFSDCIQYNVEQDRLITNEGQVSDIKIDEEWQYLMVVRDPIDRFLSGYLHFCYQWVFSTFNNKNVSKCEKLIEYYPKKSPRQKK